MKDFHDATYPLLSEQVERTYAFHATPGLRIPTGWESVDGYILGGPAPGEVVYILGRSHTAKSMFLLNVMFNNQTTPMVLFTLEMPYHQAITRLSAMATSLSDDVLIRGLQHAHYEWKANPLLRWNSWVIDEAVLSLEDMAMIIEKLRFDYVEELWPKAVLIDYLELVRTNDREHGYQRTENLARDLKAWSKAMELPVFVVHQSNMTIKRWEAPDEGAARGAGYTEADAVIGVWHPASEPNKSHALNDERKYKAQIIKNRISGKLSQPMEFELDVSLRLWDPARLARVEIF